jgi:hypothetical protein
MLSVRMLIEEKYNNGGASKRELPDASLICVVNANERRLCEGTGKIMQKSPNH